MKKTTLFLCYFFVVLVCNAQNVGDIIITELMNNPDAVTDANGEYFEIYNTTLTAIDLNGWVIEDHNSSFTIEQSVVIPAQSYAVLGRNKDSAANGGVVVDFEYSSTITLLNSGKGVVKLHHGTTLIDEVNYDYATFPFETGKSLELATDKFNATDNNFATNWKASTATYGNGDYGTPGETNTNSNTLGIGITEIKNFKLIPNPVNNGIFSVVTGTNATKTVVLFNFLGEVVFTTETVNNKLINITHLQPGVYLLKVEEENKIATRKLIVK